MNAPQAGENINFNDYGLAEITYVCDPVNNTFQNSPIQLTQTFFFKNSIAYDANTSIQIIIVPQEGVTYTRNYDFASGNYTNWVSSSGGGGAGVFKGSWNATTGKDASGAVLPTPAPENNGWWWVCSVAGKLPASVDMPTAGYAVGDGIMSDGVQYFYMPRGQAVLDSQVSLSQNYANVGTTTQDTQATYNAKNNTIVGTTQANINSLQNSKIDKISNAVAGNLPVEVAGGGLADSGTPLQLVLDGISINAQHIENLSETVNNQGAVITQNTNAINTINNTSLPAKQDKVTGALLNQIATFLPTGQVTNSEVLISDINKIATTTAIGKVSIPADGGLAITQAGAVSVNVDNVTTKIIDNKLVATSSASGINTIHTPDGVNTSTPVVNFLNGGSNVNITADNAGNVTFSVIGDGTGTVTNVSSANTDISVTDPTIAPVLTLNSTVNSTGVAEANKIVKLDNTGKFGSIDANNIQVTNPTTLSLSTLSTALMNIFGTTTAKVKYVAKSGNDTTGTGAMFMPFLTIQKAIDACEAGDVVIIMPSGNVTTTYAENITLKANISLVGASAQFVVLGGSMTTPATGGVIYIQDMRIQAPSGGNAVNFAGGTNITNLQFQNVDNNLAGGTGACLNWTNENSSSKFLSDGTCAWNVIDPTGGGKLINSSTTARGTIMLQYVSAQLVGKVNYSRVGYSINGDLAVYHNNDEIYGQVVVTAGGLFGGTNLKMTTGNVAVLVTTSKNICTLSNCLYVTTTDATPTTCLVEGTGVFYATSTYANFPTKGYASTLNGGKGGYAIPMNELQIASAPLTTFVANLTSGRFGYFNNQLTFDNISTRNLIPFASLLTGKLNSTFIPNSEVKVSANTTLTTAQLPLLGVTTVTNTASTAINITLPANYTFTSTAYGNSTTVLSLPALASVTLMTTVVTATGSVAILGLAVASGGGSSSTTVTYSVSDFGDPNIEIPLLANCKNIKILIRGLTYPNGNNNPSIRFRNSAGTIIDQNYQGVYTYVGVSSGTSVAQPLQDSLIILPKMPDGSQSTTIINANYEMNLIDAGSNGKKSWVVNGTHGCAILNNATNVAQVQQTNRYDASSSPTLTSLVISVNGSDMLFAPALNVVTVIFS